MSPTPPLLCGTLLAAMMAAGVCHYWSVEKFIANNPSTPSLRLVHFDPYFQSPHLTVLPSPGKVSASEQHPPSLDSPAAREFYETLVKELRALKNENRDLNDQIAETTRDVAKMQFQIDSHSESFRALSTSENRDDRSWDDADNYSGVLPPKATPVNLEEE